MASLAGLPSSPAQSMKKTRLEGVTTSGKSARHRSHGATSLGSAARGEYFENSGASPIAKLSSKRKELAEQAPNS